MSFESKISNQQTKTKKGEEEESTVEYEEEKESGSTLARSSSLKRNDSFKVR